MGFDPQTQPWETKRNTKEPGFVWTPLTVSGRSTGKMEGDGRAILAGMGRFKVVDCAKQGAKAIKREAA